MGSKWKVTLYGKSGAEMSVTTDDPDEIRRLERKAFDPKFGRSTAVPVDDEDDE